MIGQPGSGKTFLLEKIAQENRGLFLVTTDRDEIAAGVRAQQPTVIFVDDAGPDRNLLLTLQQMRAEIGANFSIIAVGWPGDQSTLVETLHLPNHRIHRLEPLTRDQIKEVVYGVGVRGPNELVREIVDQAEGRPGLAVTLGLLWLQGGRREVALGDTLSDFVVNFAERFICREAAQILAVIAMSGDGGFSLSAIAQLSSLPEIEVHRVLNQLTASGVIMAVGEGMLTVRPPVLRYALVRNVFFRGVCLSIAPILERVPSRPEAALVLMGARERGAAVSNQLLRPLVIESRSTEVWEAYAGLGREEAEWVLRSYPGMLAVIAARGLLLAPEAFLQALLTAAISDRRPLNQFTDHPLRQIEHWIESARPDRGQAFLRRRLLLDATEIWLRERGEWTVGGHALQFVLSPSFHYLTADPGQGHYIEYASGVLSPYELSQIQSLWPRVSRLINVINVTDWSFIHRIVEDWVY
ncbi:MAG: hypothetical protein M1305_02670, partial [Candidatus Marsarchaeota archaeon]|nr:hypothetical protein [Candidatus Marsarchaeota archaeon]